MIVEGDAPGTRLYRLQTKHFEIVSVGTRFEFFVCAKPHYDKAIRVGFNRMHEAAQLIRKLERLWPCHFLAKEWPK